MGTGEARLRPSSETLECQLSDAARAVLIVLAVILTVVVLVPLLFMGGMMSNIMGGVPLGMGGVAVIVLLAAGALLLVGVRR